MTFDRTTTSDGAGARHIGTSVRSDGARSRHDPGVHEDLTSSMLRDRDLEGLLTRMGGQEGRPSSASPPSPLMGCPAVDYFATMWVPRNPSAQVVRPTGRRYL
jgi:hypothetical protein